MRIGVELKIDVKKLDKARFYVGEKCTYATMTVFIDTNKQDHFQQNGLIKQKTNKDENVEMPILGGAKVFWQDEQQVDSHREQPKGFKSQEDEDVPF